MLDSIEVDEKDEQVFSFGTFEFVMHGDYSYILCDEGYFSIDGLQSFKKVDENTYLVINEEDDKFLIMEEDFEKIKDIYLKFS